MQTNYPFQTILDQLVQSTLRFDATTFIPFLFSDNVVVLMPNKVRFYSFYKYMLRSTKTCSVGPIHLKIEKSGFDEDAIFYNFYDDIHQYARLRIEVKYIQHKLQLEVYPF